jgi:hypothetical protein
LLTSSFLLIRLLLGFNREVYLYSGNGLRFMKKEAALVANIFRISRLRQTLA